MWSRWIVCCLAVTLVAQGLTLAAQRVLPGGHFHVAAAGHHHENDDHDHHHAGAAHFHAAIAYHSHQPQQADVVYIDDDHPASSSIELSLALKRLVLDQEQLAATAVPLGPVVQERTPLPSPRPAIRSHVAEPLDPPPRSSLT